MEKYYGYHHIQKHLYLSRFLRDKFFDLLIADTFRLVALSLVSLFIPIFLLKIGYSILEVASAELIFFVGCILAHYLVLYFLPRWGVKRTLVTSYFLNIFLYLVLYYAELLVIDFGRWGVLSFIISLNILSASFYWSAHHVYFLCSTSSEHKGEKLGILLSVPAIAGIVSPFLGSVLITDFGFRGAFLSSIFLMLIASVALFFSGDIRTDIKMDIKGIVDYKNSAKNAIFFIQGFGYCAVGFFWPILLFVLSVQLISMGFLFLFSNAFYALVSYLGGKKTDNGEAERFGRVGAIGHGWSIILRAISETVLAMTAFQSLGGLFGGMVHIIIDAQFFKHTNGNYGNAIMNRELYMHLGRICAISLFIFLFFFLPLKISLIVSLIISGLITFLLSLMIGKFNCVVNEKIC